jgi:hypothetical protein
MRPTRTEATGVLNGTLEMLSATEAPSSASTSASFSWSADRMKQATCVSCMNPSGKSGRSGPVDLPRREDLLLARPSLALEEPARDLPRRVALLRYSIVRGKNGRWVGLSCTVTAQRTTVSPYCTRHEPCASLAMRPISSVSVRPANWRSILNHVTHLRSLSGWRRLFDEGRSAGVRRRERPPHGRRDARSTGTRVADRCGGARARCCSQA